jgi:hypothetical protein
MTTDDVMACDELINLDVDTIAPHGFKQEKPQLSATLRRYYSKYFTKIHHIDGLWFNL